MQPILNLKLRLRVHHIAVLIGVGDSGAIAGMRKAQALRWRVKQATLQARNGLVDQVVDRIDNIVYERLRRAGKWSACCFVSFPKGRGRTRSAARGCSVL